MTKVVKIIDCKELSKKIIEDVKKDVEELKTKGINPKLTVLTNPDDNPSKAYVKNKRKVCEETGIEFEEIPFNEETEFNKLYELASETNPVIVQLPINKALDNEVTWKVVNDYYCYPRRDVDGFSEGALVIPATANGVMRIFEEIKYDLDGKHVCIIGRGKTCAKPLVQMILDKNATLTVCHSHTSNLSEITKTCDVVISCVGKPHLITPECLKEGAVVINVGLSIDPETNKLTGDVNFKECKKKASRITRNIGGVGLLTTACLAENVVKLYKINN